MDEEIPKLADAIYRERVIRARMVPSSQKMGWGPELFSEACSRMRAGIRMQFPESTEQEVESTLRQRLDRLVRMHEQGIFETVAR